MRMTLQCRFYRSATICSCWYRLLGWPFYNSKSSIPNGSASPFGRSWSYASGPLDRYADRERQVHQIHWARMYVETAVPLQDELQALIHNNEHLRAMPLQPWAPTSASAARDLKDNVRWGPARHTLSIPKPFFLGFDADVAC